MLGKSGTTAVWWHYICVSYIFTYVSMVNKSLKPCQYIL